jgi:hypothetical protein
VTDMSPDVRAVLDAAEADLLVRERGGGNRGWEVEAILAAVGLKPGDPWCAALVSWIGRHALGARWPLPNTGSCFALGADARKRGLLVTQPGPGDVLLLWSDTLDRYHHTGFVTAALPGGRYSSIEGNTNERGGANGYATLRKERAIGSRDRFVRWQSMVVALGGPASAIGVSDRGRGWAST